MLNFRLNSLSYLSASKTKSGDYDTEGFSVKADFLEKGIIGPLIWCFIVICIFRKKALQISLVMVTKFDKVS